MDIPRGRLTEWCSTLQNISFHVAELYIPRGRCCAVSLDSQFSFPFLLRFLKFQRRNWYDHIWHCVWHYTVQGESCALRIAYCMPRLSLNWSIHKPPIRFLNEWSRPPVEGKPSLEAIRTSVEGRDRLFGFIGFCCVPYPPLRSSSRIATSNRDDDDDPRPHQIISTSCQRNRDAYAGVSLQRIVWTQSLPIWQLQNVCTTRIGNKNQPWVLEFEVRERRGSNSVSSTLAIRNATPPLRTIVSKHPNTRCFHSSPLWVCHY